MTKGPNTEGGNGPNPGIGVLDWTRVVEAADPERVLEIVAGSTGYSLRNVSAQTPSGPPGSVRAGSENWTVEASGHGGPEAMGRAARLALDALEAWGAARAEIRRAVVRATGHGKDADALRALGLRLASARSASELLSAAGETLHHRLGIDACGMVGRFDGASRAWFCLFRPGIQPHLAAMARRALETAGQGGEGEPAVAAIPSVRFDPALPPRTETADSDLLMIPFPSGPGTAAVLAVLPTDPPDARARRIAEGVAGQLALHAERMAAAARDEEVRFRAILDAMPQAVWLVDREVRVLRGNPAASALAEVLGWPAPGPSGRIGDFDLASAVSRVLAGSPSVVDSDVRLPAGRVLSVTVSAMGSAESGAVGAVVVADDVTESRRLQSRISQAERLSSLGKMLSGVAHELNNPLATVIGFAEMARAAPAAPGLERRLRMIHDEANRCRRIVGNLLRFARRQEPERKPVVLNELVESTAGLLAYPLRVDGIRLDTELDRTLPALSADPHELQQVLINLVTNAQQAMRASDRTGSVRVRTARMDRDWILLEVTDDGPGIPDEIRDRIFDPFFTTKASGEGTGLGLSLVYGAVRAHGGTIEVDQAPGGGARFRVRLPADAAGGPQPRGEEPPPHAAPLEGTRVLVVDDEPGVSQLICEALSQDGCRPTAARDAEAVRSLLREGSFDLVVCDLRMAGLGAERLHRMLSRTVPGLERRMVLTTGDTVSHEAEKVAAATGAVLLHKPFDLQDLRAAVRAGLGRARTP